MNTQYLIFRELIKENTEEFCKKVVEISNWLGVNPNHLMFLMWFETGHTLDHRTKNKIGAVGLIQFIQSTAKYLGTTTDKLVAMSNVEQLDYVKKHLAPYRGKYKDYVDLYCAIFWPKAVGQLDTFRITSDVVAVQNPLFDINKDKDIEKAEIRTALERQIPKQYKSFFYTK